MPIKPSRIYFLESSRAHVNGKHFRERGLTTRIWEIGMRSMWSSSRPTVTCEVHPFSSRHHEVVQNVVVRRDHSSRNRNVCIDSGSGRTGRSVAHFLGANARFSSKTESEFVIYRDQFRTLVPSHGTSPLNTIVLNFDNGH